MSLLKNKNNKIYLPEDTLIFENSGTKIVTGVNPAQAEDDVIGDQVINPGDTVITTEGKQLIKNPNGSYTDLSNAGGGGGSGANTNLSNLTAPTSINQTLRPDTDNTRDIGASNRRFSFGYFFRLLVDRIQDPSSLITVNLQSATLSNAIGEDMFSWSGSNLSAKNNRIEETADPVDPTDAATKNYVDNNNQIAPTSETLPSSGDGVFLFNNLFDFDENLYSSVDGILELYVDAPIPYRSLATARALYDPVAMEWLSVISPQITNGNNLPDGLSVDINPDGILQYEATGAIFTSITAKFRAQVLP